MASADQMATDQAPSVLRIPDLDPAPVMFTHTDCDEVVSKDLRELGVWEPYETEVLRRLMTRAGVFVDIGANIGYYTVLAGRLMPKGSHVVAIEPDPRNAALLRRNIEANRLSNVTVVEAAAAAGPGVATLSRNHVNRGDNRLFAHGQGHSADRIAVPTVAVDDVLAELGLGPTLIKIDAQGAEPLILRGLTRSMQTPGLAMLVEFWPHGLLGMDSSPDEQMALLERRDWLLSAMFEDSRRIIPCTFQDLRRWGSTILRPDTLRFLNALLLPDDPAHRALLNELAGITDRVDPFAARLGATVSVADASPTAHHAIPAGWSWPEGFGRWTNGQAAELWISPAKIPDSGLMLSVKAGGMGDPRDPCQVVVRVNGRVIDRWSYTGTTPVEHKRRISAELARLRLPMTVEFLIPRPRPSPSGDGRTLGLALRSLTITQAKGG